MSIKFRKFGKYFNEASKVFRQNILSIICITFIIALPSIIGGMIFEWSHPGIYSDESLLRIYLLSSSPTNIVYFVIGGVIIFLLHSTIFSIYSFYITFKSEEEGIYLFFLLLRKYIWKIIKVQSIAYVRILLGFICLAIPGIILYFRYRGINYFTILQNGGFSKAREKSAQVMYGFKIIFFLVAYTIGQLNKFIYFKGDIVTSVIADPNFHNIIMLIPFVAVLIIISSIFDVLYWVVVYTICKYESNTPYFKLTSLVNGVNIPSTSAPLPTPNQPM